MEGCGGNMRKATIGTVVVLGAVIVLAGTINVSAGGRCYSPEGERIRSYEKSAVDNPQSAKSRAVSQAVRLYNESRRVEREAHNAEVRRTGKGYLWKELQDPVAMKNEVKQGYHIPTKAWDPQGNLIYDLTSDSNYTGAKYGGRADAYGGKADAKSPSKAPVTTKKPAAKPKAVTPPKANKYSAGWQREVGYNFEVPQGAAPPVSTAYAYGDKAGLKDIPGIYTDKIGMPCVKDSDGKLRQLFKGSDGYWYAVNDKSIPRDIRYTKGEISLKGPYGSVSFGKSYIDGIAESYGLERDEAKRRLLAYADVYVNTYRNHCQGEAGIVDRKGFLTMGQEKFDMKYGPLVAGHLDRKPGKDSGTDRNPGDGSNFLPETFLPDKIARLSRTPDQVAIDRYAAEYGFTQEETRRRWEYYKAHPYVRNIKGIMRMPQEAFDRAYALSPPKSTSTSTSTSTTTTTTTTTNTSSSSSTSTTTGGIRQIIINFLGIFGLNFAPAPPEMMSTTPANLTVSDIQYMEALKPRPEHQGVSDDVLIKAPTEPPKAIESPRDLLNPFNQ